MMPSGLALASMRRYAGLASILAFHAATLGNKSLSTSPMLVATFNGNIIMMSAAENSAPPNQAFLARKSSENCTTPSLSTRGNRFSGGWMFHTL